MVSSWTIKFMNWVNQRERTKEFRSLDFTKDLKTITYWEVFNREVRN